MKTNLALLLGCFLYYPAMAQEEHNSRETEFFRTGQWANYGNDPGGMRFSPLDQIHPGNISDLKPAWTFRTGELETYQGTEVASKSAFEATPIMVDGILFFSTPTNRVFALDGSTGKKLWDFDPGLDLLGDYSEITSRGVSKWTDNTLPSGTAGALRIFVATIDGRLMALDAGTGKLIPSFGDQGTIDLKQNVGDIQVTSPPAVINDLIICGSTMGDNQRLEYPPGVVRAFNARTGELAWSWDPIPRGSSEDIASRTWKGPKVHKTGAANAWAPISADLDRDLVYVPTSSPSPDYYGGERIGENRYANSLVALKASTGEVVWHFQAVHHDLWDYDLPAQPLLIELEKNGIKREAVVVVTKMGHIFVLDREDGEPIFPIEERQVPPSDIPGEQASPTQPFPAVLPLLGLRSVSEDDAWGPTPEMEEAARERIRKHKNSGAFTPPSFEGTMVTPSSVGGMNWSGATFDPGRNLLITNTNRLAALITLFPRQDHSRKSINTKFPRSEIGLQEGTPYLMTRDYLFTLSEEDGRVMQTKPPWGTLAAVNLSTGQLEWEVPLGIMMNPEKYPEAADWGSINIGGAVATAGGLTFIAASMDGAFRAFNSVDGSLLWSYQLPAGGQATPMSYQLNGRQFVVIAAGGHGKFGTQLGDYLIAFALDPKSD